MFEKEKACKTVTFSHRKNSGNHFCGGETGGDGWRKKKNDKVLVRLQNLVLKD